MVTNILVFINPNTSLHPSLRDLSSDFSIQVQPPPLDGHIPEFFENPTPRLVVIDTSKESAWEGLARAKAFRKVHKTIPIILLIKEGSEDFAQAVLRSGINDYLKDPFDLNEIINSLNRCLSQSSYIDSMNGQNITSSSYIAESLIGESQAIKELRAYITRVSITNSNVLITGETGTGKELVARLIHEESRGRDKTFVCVNCAAIPETLLESELFGHERGAYTGALEAKRGQMELAQGGTILFDEIGDMSLSAQVKILRAIEERKIYRLGGKSGVTLNVRILAATNQDLDLEMSSAQFRKDLYYRLNVAKSFSPATYGKGERTSPLLSSPLYSRNSIRNSKDKMEDFTDEAKRFFIRILLARKCARTKEFRRGDLHQPSF